MRLLMVLGLCVAASQVATSQVQAATFTKLKSNDGLIVRMTGPLVEGDYERFIDTVGTDQIARLSLSSDGGSVITALHIGGYVRDHHLATQVSGQDRCASACAVIWVAGSPRYVGQSAQVGFHAAYDSANNNQVTSVGNALIGAYLARMGLGNKAVTYVTSAPPNEMQWLSLADARAVGIDVKLLVGPGTPTTTSIEQNNPLSAEATISAVAPAAPASLGSSASGAASGLSSAATTAGGSADSLSSVGGRPVTDRGSANPTGAGEGLGRAGASEAVARP
jgi:hypothetical protein